MSAATADLDPYLTVENVFVKPVFRISVMSFLYGLYTYLFGGCIRILMKRNGRRNRDLYLAWSIALYLLISTLNVIETCSLFGQAVTFFNASAAGEYSTAMAYVRRHDGLKTMWDVLTQVFGLSTAFLSDTMLMHRCYIIWGSSRRIAVLMIMALITVVAIAVIQAVMTTFIAPQYPSKQMLTSYLSFTFRVTNTVFNFGLTGLTAGRIWWIARRIDMQKKYCTIVAILLESGIIYPMVQILDLTFNYVIFPQQSRAPGFPFDLFEVVYHACGIAPALIIVRAEARKTVETEVSEL